MAKEQHTFDLKAVNAINHPVTLAKDRVAFLGHKSYFRVVVGEHERSVRVITPNGVYTLPKRNGRYEGECGKIRVHVCLKKVVGKLHAWY